MGPSLYSRYCIVVDNLSGSTRTDDVEYEASYFGKIRDLARDHRARCAIIEFDRASDARSAWEKLDGFKMNGRTWKVEYATYDDFKMFGWRWFEGRSPSPPPRKYSRGRSRSRSPPDTPHDKDRKRGNSNSPDGSSKRASRSKSRTPSPEP